MIRLLLGLGIGLFIRNQREETKPCMTKEEFLEKVNFGRNPKRKLSEVHTRRPFSRTNAIVATESGSLRIAEYDGGKWYAVSFSSCMYSDGTYDPYHKQEATLTEIKEKVIYWV